MKRILSFLLIIMMSLAATATAFEGRRQGFVLGGGIGLAPSAHWSTDYAGRNFSESKVGFAENLFLGYGVNEKNLVVLEVNIASYYSDIYAYRLIQGFGGVSWYHYFGPQDHSLFSVVGLGVYRFVSSMGFYINISFDGYDETPPLPDGATGLGFLIGGGYELARHIQAAIYLSAGETSEWGAKYSNFHIDFLLCAVAF